MLRTAALLAIVLTSTSALADTAKDVTTALGYLTGGAAPPPEDMKAPRFAVSGGGADVAPTSVEDSRSSTSDIGEPRKVVVGISGDKTAAWINSDIAEFMVCGDSRDCYKKPESWSHATALFEIKGTQPVAWQIISPVTGKEQQAALAKGVKLPALDEKIDKGAEDPAKIFKDTLGDPKKLAATVSDRKDAVMYGSELAERYVGGAKIKSQLAKWNLSFKVTSGVQAGLTKSQTVAFVAAVVEATSVKNPKAKPSPYRVFAIYEKTITSWKLVSLHFGFTTY